MRRWIISLGLVLLSGIVIVAQTGDCEAIVTQALGQVETLCEGLERNGACYGASTVNSETVVSPAPDGFFSQAGDQEPLPSFTQIRPAPLNPETEEFGVSLLNVQANVPNTVPGQSVLFMLVGDAALTNEIEIGDGEQTAFQSFYFLPGIGGSPCYEAEPTLTIQTPGGISTTLILNGVETEFSPGTLLTITDSVCTIHRGNIIRKDENGVRSAALLSNESVDIFIDDAGAINVTNKRAISQREYERGELIQNTLNAVAFANDWEAQFLTPPDEFGIEPETTDAPDTTDTSDVDETTDATETDDTAGSSDETADAATDDCETQHTVGSGETLHMIAERYDTSLLGIAEFNGIDNPRVIFPGTVLCIPDVGSGFEPLPAGS